MPTAIEIFCCYAREDQELMKALRKHLMPLQRRGLITIWSDTDIDAGEAWEDEIKKHLNSAHIILLLVSPDFMASDYCYSTEMERALQRNARGEARVIPIILRPTAWKGAPFDKLQVLPTNAKPVTDGRSWQSIDEALNDVTEHVSPVVFDLLLPLYIDEAEQLVKQDKPAEALAIYTRVLNLNPEYAPALYGKGATLLLLEHYDESAEAYEQAIQASLDHPDARYFYGKANALRHLQRVEESLVAYDEAIRLNPRRVRVYKEKADILLKLERYTQALEVLDQLAKIDKENAAEHYLLKGQTLEKLGRYIEAIEAYDHAIPDDPGGAWIETLCQRKGDLLLDLKRYEEAVDAYRQAINHNPRNALYHENMGKALLELKRYEEALAAFEEAIQLRKDADPTTCYDKGKALSGLERYEEALEAYNNAIRLSADHPDPRFYHDKAVVLGILAQRAYEMEREIRKQRGEEVVLPAISESVESHNMDDYIEDLGDDGAIVPSNINAVKPEELTLLRTIKPHKGKVLCIAISPVRQMLASCSGDALIKVWSLETSQELWTLAGHDSSIYSIAFSPDGHLLASGSYDKTIKLWNLQTGQVLYSLTGHTSTVYSIAFSSDGHLLASGSQDHSIKLWKVETGEVLSTLTGHIASVRSVAFSLDGQTLASGGDDRIIKLWNSQTNQVLYSLTGHTGHVYSTAFSSDGHLLVSGSADGTIKLWNPQIGKPLGSLTTDLNGLVNVAMSPNGQYIVGRGDEAIKFWSLQSRQELRTLQTSSTVWINTIAFSPDGQYFVSGQDDGTIQVWGKK